MPETPGMLEKQIMNKGIQFLVFIILLPIVALAFTAILLPLFSKIHMLEIVTPLPKEVKAGKKYALCIYRPDKDGENHFAKPGIKIFINEKQTAWTPSGSESLTYGQEVGSGRQVVAIELGTFLTENNGALRVDADSQMNHVEMGLLTDRWKIVVSISGIIFSALLATTALWWLICKKQKSK